MDVRVVHPMLLFALWAVPLLAWWWHVRVRRAQMALAALTSPAARERRVSFASRRERAQIVFLLSALPLLVVAASRPQTLSRRTLSSGGGWDWAVVLDVSRSMLAEDVHPNRLLHAKADVADMLHGMEQDRVALVAVRRGGVLLCPLTSDRAFLAEILDGADIDSAPPGETDIGSGLSRAAESLTDGSGRPKAILLVSDGEDLAGTGITAAERVAQRGIRVFTLGEGTAAGAIVPKTSSGETSPGARQGDAPLTRLSPDALQSIAHAGGGAYILSDPSAASRMNLAALRRLYGPGTARTGTAPVSEVGLVERYQWFLLPAVLFLLAACLLSRGRLATSSRTVTKTAIALLCFALFLPAALADGSNTLSGWPGAGRAERLYAQGLFSQAAESYAEAARRASGNRRNDWLYNAAVSHLHAGQFESSAALWRSLLAAGPANREPLLLGLGCATYGVSQQCPSTGPGARRRVALLREAGEAFREALAGDPDCEPARRNLAAVLAVLPEAERTADRLMLSAAFAASTPSQLAAAILSDVRGAVLRAAQAFTNDSPAQILHLEAISGNLRTNAALCDVLAVRVAAAGSSSNVAAEAAGRLVESANHLRDLDPRGYDESAQAEEIVYSLWRGLASCPELLAEDLRRQTNAIMLVLGQKPAGPPSRDRPLTEQREAHALTRLFTAAFTKEKPKETPPPPRPERGALETRMAAATATQALDEVILLAEDAATNQLAAADRLNLGRSAAALPFQRKSHDRLKEIEERLKSSGKGPTQAPPNPSQKPPPEAKPSTKTEPPEPGVTAGEASPSQQDIDVRRILDAAVEREREHMEARRRLGRRIPPPPLDRDW